MFKNHNLLSFIPHILFVLAFACIAHILHLQSPLLVGTFTGSLAYIAAASLLKRIIPTHHRRALKYLKKLDFQKAAENFEQSYLFFKKHPYLDKFRVFTILSASKLSYHDLALLNMAYCHFQLGQKKKSRICYQKILQKNPKNKFAQAGLEKIK